MGQQGTTRRASKVTPRERLEWAHDRMMVALRRAAANRADTVLTTAAFARVEEYDKLLAASLAEPERKRREGIRRSRLEASRKNYLPETT